MIRRWQIMLMDTDTGAETRHGRAFTERAADRRRDRLNAQLIDTVLHFYVLDRKGLR